MQLTMWLFFGGGRCLAYYANILADLPGNECVDKWFKKEKYMQIIWF